MTYRLIDTSTGNILGMYQHAADALASLKAEAELGGSVNDLAVTASSGSRVQVIATGEAVSAGRVVDFGDYVYSAFVDDLAAVGLIVATVRTTNVEEHPAVVPTRGTSAGTAREFIDLVAISAA
jgi:hypothetical protein